MCQSPGVFGWCLGRPWCDLGVSRPWCGQGAAAGLLAGRGLFGAVVAAAGCLPANAMATRPTEGPPEAACGLWVVWGHVKCL